MSGRSSDAPLRSREAYARALERQSAGDLAGALVAAEEAAQFAPTRFEPRLLLADLQRGLGDLPAAARSYRHVTMLEPGCAEAWVNLGNLELQDGRLEAAIDCYRRAIAVKPSMVEAHSNIGVPLIKLGRLDQAVDHIEQALAINDAFPGAWRNLANARLAQGRIDEAVACNERCLVVAPEDAEALSNLGNCHLARGDVASAEEAYERAVALDPDLADARLNRGLLKMLRGDLAAGWPDYELRWRARDSTAFNRGFAQPIWTGRRIDGATLLLHAEQGFGDTLQFIRFAPWVARASGAKLLIEAQPALMRLLSGLAGRMPGVEAVIAAGDALPAFDFHCPMLSAPGHLGVTLASIPPPLRLAPDPSLAASWRAHVGAAPGLKIGIVWAGNPRHANDRNRSIPPAILAGLSDLALQNPDALSFFSLQKDAAPEALAASRIPWSALGGELRDFADTGAAVSALDLVITIDSAVAHLAGTIGRPTWLLLPFNPDWRWMLGRADTPWYPETRLVRQPRPGDWSSVVAAVRANLQAKAARILNNAGVRANANADRSSAAGFWRRSVALDPGLAEAHNNLGNLFSAEAQYAEAISCYETAVRLKPDFSLALRGLTLARKAHAGAPFLASWG